MIVGFTGTRKGMSVVQAERLVDVLTWLAQAEFFSRSGRLEFHHGCAEGADSAAAIVAHRMGYELVPHPVYAGDPLLRNRDIVKACMVLVAAPYTDKETVRSGSWYTVRRARDEGKPVVFLPRGV